MGRASSELRPILAVSASGEVFIADPNNARVDVFGSDGVFKRAFGKGVNPAGGDVCTSTCQAGTSSRGGAGQIDPTAVAVSGSGDVFVVESNARRVSVFSSDGVFKRAFGKGVNPAGGDVCTYDAAGRVPTAAGRASSQMRMGWR